MTNITPLLLSANFPSISSVSGSLVPLVIAALLVDGMIIGVWYMLGYLINNQGVKKSAQSEVWQLIGTAALISIILFSLAAFSGLFQSALNGSSLLSQSTISTMCYGIGSHSQMALLQINPGSNGIIAPLCSVVSGSASDLATSALDYPLAASGVIIANMTNQTVNNLNGLFVVDAYVGFLSKLSPMFIICIPGIVGLPVCIVPSVPPLPPPDLLFSWTATPYAGMEMIYRGLGSLGILFTSSLESFIIQLTILVIFLYIWPFLIFGGLVLRATPFTRKIGGLFIAVAIGAIFFYPTVFTIQYLVLGHGLGNVPVYSPSNVFAVSSNSISYIYGFNGLYTNPVTALPNTNLNFFVMPKVSDVANAYGCWPPNGATTGALTAEETDVAYQLIPFVSLAELASSLALQIRHRRLPD